MARQRAEVALLDEDTPSSAEKDALPRGQDGASPPGNAPTADVASLALAADLNFAAARDLHAALLPLKDRARVEIDAAKVERMSTAAVLVIVSFLNARTEVNPPATVVGASGAFIDAFSELGLFACLMRMEFAT